jgi:hypothetical protein
MSILTATAWPGNPPAATIPWERLYARAERAMERVELAQARRVRVTHIDGIAARFNIPFTPIPTKLPQGSVYAMMPGALDDNLADVRAGRHTVPLTLGHDGEIIATTRTALKVWVARNELRCRLDTTTGVGKDALAAIQERGHSDLSVGVRGMTFTPTEEEEPINIIALGVLYEIAVVPKGAVAGCRLLGMTFRPAKFRR